MAFSSDEETDNRARFEITEDDIEDEIDPFRSRRRFTKDDAIYGVFNDDSDDEGEKNSRRRGGARDSSYTAPISFVAGKKSAKSPGGRKANGDGDSQEDEEDEDGEDRLDGDSIADDDEVMAREFGESEAAPMQDDEDDGEENDNDEYDARPMFKSDPGVDAGKKEEKLKRLKEVESRVKNNRQATLKSSLPFAKPLIPQKNDADDELGTSKKSSRPGYSLFTKDDSASKKLSKEFGAWEKHTKGFGLKMLEKMGYKRGEGIGVASQGIVNPIDVKLRRKGEALQDDGERTKQSRQDFPTFDPEADKDQKFKEELEQWKIGADGKKKPRRAKYQYKTAEEVAKEGNQLLVTPSNDKIIDMSGPVPQVMSNYSGLRSKDFQSAPLGFDASLPMAEFQYNLKLYVDQASTDLQQLNSKIIHERSQVSALTSEIKKLQVKVNHEEKTVTSLESLTSVIAKCQARFLDKEHPLSLLEAYELFSYIQRAHGTEYTLYKLGGLAVSVVLPLVKTQLENWDASIDPKGPIHSFVEWKLLLEPVSSQPSVVDQFNPPDQAETMDDFEILCWEAFLPRARGFFSKEWKVRDPEAAVSMLTHWESVLPPWIMANILEQLVLPRLKREVDDWDPAHDKIPIHLWIFPWLPLLGHGLADFYPTVRQRLASTLRSWHPSDPSAKLIISPWKDVFSEADMSKLISRSIIPALATAFQAEFSINPAQQDLSPVHWMLDWVGLALPKDLAPILESNFLPKFIGILCEWLSSPHVNVAEVVQWYQGWRALLAEFVRASSVVMAGFGKCLEILMNYTGASLPHASYFKARPAHPASISPSISPFHPSLRSVPSTKAQKDPQATRLPSGLSDAHVPSKLNMKDMVQQLADSKGIVYVPRSGRTIDGKPLYSFGAASIYIDKNVIFVKNEEGKFLPVSFSSLLKYA